MRWLCIWAAVLPAALDAQEAAERPGALRVFLDCAAACPLERIRREITFVNWVRDQADAHLYLLVTQRTAGSGGSEYSFDFIGRDSLASRADTLRFVSRPLDSQNEVWDGIVQTLQLGLVRYVAGTAVARQLRIEYRPLSDWATVGRGHRDPWDSWVFSTSVSGSLAGEERQRSVALSGSLAASRVTEAFKLSFNVRGSYSRDEFELSPTERFVSTLRDYRGSALAVWSVGPHWSTGVKLSVGSYSFLNQTLALEGAPAVEYSVFSYDESTRRQLTFLYTAGVYVAEYEDTTIFDRTHEVLPVHTLSGTLLLQQPWGSASTSLSASQYLHDPSKHEVQVAGGLNLRLYRGLSLSVGANAARIKDQIYLSKAGLTPEEILLRRAQLGTDYRYGSSLGFSYQFGSVWNNVVNPRM